MSVKQLWILGDISNYTEFPQHDAQYFLDDLEHLKEEMLEDWCEDETIVAVVLGKNFYHKTKYSEYGAYGDFATNEDVLKLLEVVGYCGGIIIV